MTLRIEKYSEETHRKRFSTEDKCRNYLVETRWDGRPKCHHCGNRHMNYFISTRKIWKCSSCKKQFSILKDTIFEATKLPLTIWFKAIYYFTTNKRGLSSYQLASWCGVEQRTAWFMMIRMREALRQEGKRFLKGIVEIDEAYFSPDPGKKLKLQREKKLHWKQQDELYGFSPNRQYKIRKKLKKEPDGEKRIAEFNKQQRELAKNGKRIPWRPAIAVLGMLERGGSLVLYHIGNQYVDTTAEKIRPYVINTIDPSSEIVTDESSFYTTVGKSFKAHRIVNHDIQFVTSDGTHTNGIEGVWSHLSRKIIGSHFHLSHWHFFRYLNEMSHIWNVRDLPLRQRCDDFIPLVFQKRARWQDVIIKKEAA